MGAVLKAGRRFSENAAAKKWQEFMLKGDFESAWRISDELLNYHAGKSCMRLPRHFQYIWNGAALDDKCVLIRCYHGLGDTIQFIRYLPLVSRVASKIYVWIQPELIGLAKTMGVNCQFLPLNNSNADLDYDADVELMELPHVFRTNLKTVPNRVPYFHLAAVKIPDHKKFSIGIVWETGDWDKRRFIPVSLVARLGKITDIDLYILQRGEALKQLNGGLGIMSGSDDILKLARIIKSLDLVISPDTMIAHLAGALAVPVWTLLHKDADWRWMQDRNDSPWYPSMTLFRQKTPGRWEPVIEQVIDSLRQLI